MKIWLECVVEDCWIGAFWRMTSELVLKKKNGDVIEHISMPWKKEELGLVVYAIGRATSGPNDWMEFTIKTVTKVWICLVPCFPIVLQMERVSKKAEWERPEEGETWRHKEETGDISRYFVLDYGRDENARKVLKEYAVLVQEKSPEVAEYLRDELGDAG